MKKLIINADDLGISNHITEAIKTSYQKNTITGSSLVACGKDFSEACKILKDLGKKEIGVHLTLTGGFVSLTGLNKSHSFPSGFMQLAWFIVAEKLTGNQIYKELKTQIEKIKQEGFIITHLDGHEHVHVMPKVINQTIKLAKEYDIPYVRLPLERGFVMGKRFVFKDLLRHLILKAFARIAKRKFDKNQIQYNDHFLGHFHAGRIDKEILDFLFNNVQEGITEVALHPALVTAEFLKEFPWYKNSQVELESILDLELEDRGLELVTHSEAFNKR